MTGSFAGRRQHALPALALCAAAILLFVTSPTSGDFWWYDASRHAMNGVFIRDAIVSGGVFHPKEFALAYYERYPALSIGFYPPMLYLISALFLLVFGVSHAVSQAVVAGHALVAAWFAYLLCVDRLGKTGAVLAALLLLFVPDMALWSRQVQPDVPAVAWLLAFAYCLIRHLREGRVSVLFVAAIVLGGAVLTRVQMVFALPVFAAVLLCLRYPGRPRLSVRLAAIAVAASISLPAAGLPLYFRSETSVLVSSLPGMPDRWSVGNWLWYVRALPSQIGIPALALVATGTVGLGMLWHRSPARQDILVLGGLFAVSWLMFSLISNKEPRFNLPSVALLLLLSAVGLGALRRGLAMTALGVVVALLFVKVGIMTSVPFVAGYVEAAQAALSVAREGTNIMISAHRDGSFIYNVRVLGGDRNVGTRRADKMLVDIRISRLLGIRDLGFDKEALLSLMEQQQIEIVVAQPGYLDDQPTMRALGEVLTDPAKFALLSRIPMRGQTDRSENQLLIYRRL